MSDPAHKLMGNYGEVYIWMEFVLNRMALGCEHICKKERKREETLEGSTLAHRSNAEKVRASNDMVRDDHFYATRTYNCRKQSTEAFYVNVRRKKLIEVK